MNILCTLLSLNFTIHGIMNLARKGKLMTEINQKKNMTEKMKMFFKLSFF